MRTHSPTISAPSSCRLAALVALAFIAPLSALTLVPFLLLVASVPVWLSRRAGIEGERVMAELGQLNAVTVETIQGLPEQPFSAAAALQSSA